MFLLYQGHGMLIHSSCYFVCRQGKALGLGARSAGRRLVHKFPRSSIVERLGSPSAIATVLVPMAPIDKRTTATSSLYCKDANADAMQELNLLRFLGGVGL